MSYAGTIEAVSAYLCSIPDGGPLRVAVDGRTACGKSTFARALAGALSARGCNTLHTTIDGFHNPRSVRYARGRLSAEGYYRDARDLGAIRRELLAPLGMVGTGPSVPGYSTSARTSPPPAPPCRRRKTCS